MKILVADKREFRDGYLLTVTVTSMSGSGARATGAIDGERVLEWHATDALANQSNVDAWAELVLATLEGALSGALPISSTRRAA